MAKVGLAAELAKQAAQAAREEMGDAGSKKGGGKKGQQGWTPAVLPMDFNLDRAMTVAVTRVAAHYRQKLAPEGLEMTVVADTTQAMPILQADLREGGTGRVVKAYTAGDLLAMFASQQRLNGVVVDGQV